MSILSARVAGKNPAARLLAVLALTASLLTVSSALAPSASAVGDGCYHWPRNLSQGMSGSDVAQLQIRIAGWMSYGEVLVIDGDFGPATYNAVRRFQAGYGLTVDGIAGPQTLGRIVQLQKDDCSPEHFSWAEVSENCGRGLNSNGSVSLAEVRENLKRAMWKAEALRHKLGDRAIIVSSGFRDKACDGSPYGQHTYGRALDLVPTWNKTGYGEFCDIAQAARYAGYNGIFGPGYPDHYDHVHVDSRPGARTWDAYPDCGVIG
ncbi:MAG: peptidoglycan-binding protein [Sporichthyaceae bacterium]|nr:peptidoglycan-binding protein [Sporichthyaceae bacterium]